MRVAYELKEFYSEFNLAVNLDEKRDEKFDSFINQFNESTSSKLREFGWLLENWRESIKNSFIRAGKQRLSNGLVEGINSRVKTIIKNSNGFKSFKRLRNIIIYSINSKTSILGVAKNSEKTKKKSNKNLYIDIVIFSRQKEN